MARPDWKQEVNQRLAAHRTRRNSTPEASDRQSSESPRVASARAAEAAAKVAARYANAPSYNQLLASEARAVVRAAGAAAEAARDAQAAAEAVLAGLQSAPLQSALWQPAPQTTPNAAPPIAAQAPPAASQAPSGHIPAPRWQDEPPAEEVSSAKWAGAQPRWEETLPVTAPPPVPPRNEPVRDVWAEMRVHSLEESRSSYHYDADEGELFPPDAVLSATVEPVQHLPANLIEFPRELIASRKARPRLAEGPYYNAAQDSPQLSIFEVDPELLAPPLHLNAAHHEIAPPEWASIELDHHPEPAYEQTAYEQAAYERAYDQAYSPARNPARNPAYDQAPAAIAQEHPHVQAYAQSYSQAAPVETHYEEAAAADALDFVDFYPAEAYPAPAEPLRETVRETIRETLRETAPAPAQVSAVELLVAPVSDRLLATVVDAALVTLAYLVAVVVVIASTAHPPTGRIALIASASGLAIFSLIYQYLFLSFAEEGTLGMRYARIALCTFDDDNPTREQMQMRIPAMLISALPLGLGMAWAIFDRDHLGWHDRLTKTYQRKY
jgi:uncharacterized RDD family membrane protein YckC